MGKGNEPAYPVIGAPGAGQDFGGLTKREHVAIEMAKAMISTAAAPCLAGLDGAEDLTARAAIRMADALLAALERSHDGG